MISFFQLKNKKVCSVGCYADNQAPNRYRDLNGLGLTLTNTNGGGSIASCLAYCKARGFIYAGVEFGYKKSKNKNIIEFNKWKCWFI